MQSGSKSFLQLAQHPFKFNCFLLIKLPSAFFCGVRLKSINTDSAVVTVPYKWLSQNPFKSTYFACLSMAAEMSTGLLAMLHTYKRNPSVSMLVTGLEAAYFKKAVGVTAFTCTQGNEMKIIIEEAIQSGEAKFFKATSIGKNSDGEIVATFYITWSFKAKIK